MNIWGDPLERLAGVVDFEVFRGPLIAALRRSVRGKGGRPPFDTVMMFKILVLQALYSLSGEATEFQIKDRLSFQRFLGLGLDGTVPDATTVWLFRERLVQAKAIDKLFTRFDAALKDRGYLAMGGQIIDATVVPAPKQRNTEAEKAAIKEDRMPDDWKPAKVRQKDLDVRWSIKYSKAKVREGADPKSTKPVDLAIPMFGYKNHIGIDRAHGLIRTWGASAANAHDGARLPDLISKGNTGSGVWADTAYRSKKNEAFLAGSMFKSHIHQRRKPRKSLPERIAKANTRRSKIRAQVEHVFAGQNAAWGWSCALSHRPCDHQDRHGQPCLQLPAPRLALGANCARLMPIRHEKPTSQSEINRSNPVKRPLPRCRQPGAPLSRQNRTVLRGVQLVDQPWRIMSIGLRQWAHGF